ncbi:MAG: Tex family protein [Bacillota bacterium]
MRDYFNFDIFKLASQKTGLKEKNIKDTVELLDDGNTVPFIARYRKEVTGSLDEKEIRDIEDTVDYLRRLWGRKEEVAEIVDGQEKLTDELLDKLFSAETLQEVEDIYRPYVIKKKTKAARAIEKGLKPLAEIFMAQDNSAGKPEEIAKNYLDPEKDLHEIEDVLSGAEDIAASFISDDADLRKKLREHFFKNSLINSELKKAENDPDDKYQDYYEFNESINKIPPHRILAINRGENEDVLKVKIKVNDDRSEEIINNHFNIKESYYRTQINNAKDYAYKRLIAPSLEREVRNYLNEKAEARAIDNFSINLKSLLMQPPLPEKVVFGIDPAFRTGCKTVVVSKNGKVLNTGTIYPHPPQKEKKEAAEFVKKQIKKYGVDLVVIGNGTASRETELFIADLINDGLEVEYTIVNEAGASVYSASEIARKEFPNLDVSIRGAISIARRVQDPLAELVKIDPRSLGVGMYQHDISENKLSKALKEVVVDAVNHVGVDLNSASAALLSYVSGISSNNAEKLVEHRDENGNFKSRKEMLSVYGFGPKTFEQSAGFIRIESKQDPFAVTPIHPESYDSAERILNTLNFTKEDLLNKEKLEILREKLNGLNIGDTAETLDIGLPTAEDIVKSLQQPGRDPRIGMPGPVFRKDILKLEDIKEGMIFTGKVRNIVDFGAFIDIGLKNDGLLHISEMSEMYVNDPFEIVYIGQTIEVQVLSVDQQRSRISLTLKF